MLDMYGGRAGRHVRRALAPGLVALSSLGAGVARADGEPDPTALVPPRVVSEVAPRYPAGETRDTSVLLEIVVDKDGSPTDVRVVEGGEPFASAALDAVRGADPRNPAVRLGDAQRPVSMFEVLRRRSEDIFAAQIP